MMSEKMRQNFKKYFFLIVFSGVFSGNVFAISKEAKKNFPAYVKQQCQPSLLYDLDMDFREVQGRYHERINCIFNKGMETMVRENHTEFRLLFEEVGSAEILEDVTFAGNCSLEEIAGLQEENGFESQCFFDAGESLVERPYSACRVTEMVMNEFCGYEEYWALKMEDGASRQVLLGKEQKDGNAGDAYKGLDGQDLHYESEIAKSEEILWMMIRRYKEFETAHRLHLWYALLHENLLWTQQLLWQIRTAVESWPEKFINAASRVCDQIRYLGR